MKFEIYVKNYVYRLIFNLVRPNFSLVASPSSCRHLSASVRVRPRIRGAAVLGGIWWVRSPPLPPQHFDFVKLFLHGSVAPQKKNEVDLGLIQNRFAIWLGQLIIYSNMIHNFIHKVWYLYLNQRIRYLSKEVLLPKN